MTIDRMITSGSRPCGLAEPCLPLPPNGNLGPKRNNILLDFTLDAQEQLGWC